MKPKELKMDDEIDLREYFNVIKKHWKIILLAMIIGVIGMKFQASREKPTYEATTKIMIRAGGGGGNAFAGLSGLAGMGFPSGVGGGSGADLIDLAQSRAVAARVLTSLHLKERIKGWNDPNISEQSLISSVQGMLKKPSNQNNMIELTVNYGNKELVAEIADGFAEALSYYWNLLNATEARKKREYIENQLPRVEKELKAAEEKYKKSNVLASSNISISGGSLQNAASTDRLYQVFAIQNSIYNMLKTQYENVKLEEAKETPPFLVIDNAIKPDKWKPKSKNSVLLGLGLGLFVGIFISFVIEFWAKLKKT